MARPPAARRHHVGLALAGVLVAGGCDGGPGGSGARDGDVSTADASADALDAPSVSPDPPPQDLTPVMIERPVVVKPGARLRGLFVQSAEGAQERWALWDTQLETRCSLETAEDGKVRCLPISPSSWSLDHNTGFLDAECTEVALPEVASCSGSFGFKVTAAGRAIHRLGPAVERTALYERYTVNGVPRCEPRPLPMPMRYFTLGEKLPATSFVERTLRKAEGRPTQRFQQLYDELADGTRVLASWLYAWDTQLDGYCRVLRADDGWLRCLPSAAMSASSVSFSDDRCTRSAGQSTRQPPEKYAILTDGAGCTARRRVFRVGSPIAAGHAYRILNERCVPIQGGSGYYTLDEELPAQHFAAFRPALVGTGRLEERYFVGDDGVPVREFSSLWDTQLGQLCSFDFTSSGRRCVPPYWNGVYANETCSARAGSVGSALCGVSSAAPATPMVSVASGSWCAPDAVPTLLAPAMGAQVPGRAFTRSFVTGACVSTTFSEGPEYRPLAGPADLTLFAPGTEGMD